MLILDCKGLLDIKTRVWLPQVESFYTFEHIKTMGSPGSITGDIDVTVEAEVQ